MTEPLYEKPIKRHRLIFLLFTILAFLTPIIVVIVPWLPSEVDLPQWFQRSGSLVIVLAIVAESSAIAIYNILNPSGLVSTSFEEVNNQYGSLPNKYTKIALLLIGLGTLIWGYGDLLPVFT